jgi:thiosulfate/3-mercaptopyruvate sulfurtransferase
MSTLEATATADDTRHHVLVEPQWLQDHLSDPLVRLVEVDVSSVSYDEGHLPGARLWNVYRDLKDSDYRLRSSAELTTLMDGIDPASTVVFYGYAPAMGFWLMKLSGHPDVRILNASKETWRAEGRPMSISVNLPATSAYVQTRVGEAVRAELEDVRAAVSDSSITLLDVRSGPEFSGERFWPSGAPEELGRAGHIPGAVHVPIDGVIDERGAYRSAPELLRLFENVKTAGPVITYCAIGGRASTAWFVLTYLLGRDDVRVYDGSWAEWGRLPDTSVATA